MSENAKHERPRFYCAGAIRGEIFDGKYFDRIIQIVKEFGVPETEKVGYKLYPLESYIDGEKRLTGEKRVAERDRKWIRRSRAMIAEVSGASTGTGWEICYATRVVRIPTLCLYHTNSLPSLMIKQDDAKYTIVQEYRNESEFDTYVRCFLETSTRLVDINEIKDIYLRSREITAENPTPTQIKNRVEELIKQPFRDAYGVQTKWKVDIDTTYIVIPRKAEIDFKVAAQFAHFLFRNLVLQKRWKKLATQEIGATFVGGRKPLIIKALSKLEQVPERLLQIYVREGEARLKYTREAFTKNVRAFRRIGLLNSPIGFHPRRSSTKFEDNLILVETLYGDILIESTRSAPAIMSNLVVVSQHLQHLSMFLETFNSKPLVDSLLRAENQDLLSRIPEIPSQNIDEVDPASFTQEKWAQDLMPRLNSECKTIWSQVYSTFM